MKRFMNWLTNSFTPTMNKFSQKPVVAALSSSMQKIIPFILTGSCIHLYNVLRSTIPALPNFIRIINFSFGMLGLLTAFMAVSYTHLDVYKRQPEKNSDIVPAGAAGCLSVLV